MKATKFVGTRGFGFSSYFDAFRQWCTMIFLLTLESYDERYKRSRWSALLAIGEPLFVIGFLSYIHMSAPFGSSPTLFFATGIIPYYLFYHTSVKVTNVDLHKPEPRTTEFDQIIARCMGELMAKIVILTVMAVTLWVNGASEAIPRDPFICLASMITIVVMAAAMGVFNAIITTFFIGWGFIYMMLVRVLMIFSGAAFVADQVPLSVREMISINPLSHSITWFRDGYFSGYPIFTLDLNYLFSFAAIMAVVAFVAERYSREWRRARTR